MVFHPLHCVISSKTINKVADEIIDIATLSTNKNKLRNTMMFERLQQSNQHTMLTCYEINQMTRSLSKSYIRPEVVGSTLKKISKNLQRQYTQLANIFQELR